ncbi:hypothetical protein QSV34_01500 [Porticoccus sp. W117]|nr:hypothetical protein [Porticoccus sp. W117]MDM3870021.1 hypothetical protein [Porticoccus sp. W117]
MSEQEQQVDSAGSDDNGKTDAMAALFAVLLVVAGMIYWVSQQ